MGEEDDEQQQLEPASLDLRSLKALSVLGRGAKGVVFLVRNEDSRKNLALKVISKDLIQKKNKEREDRDGGGAFRRIWFERDVLKLFRHPLLPKLRGVLETDKVIGLAIDYCPGGDLNSLRKRQTEKMFSDDSIRFYAAELVLALEHLHELGIVYRDLKPENVMIQENGHLMLIDFNLSTKLSTKSSVPLQILPPITKRSKARTVPPSVKKRRFPAFCLFYKSGISPVDSVSSGQGRVNPERSDSAPGEKSHSFVGTEEYVAPEIIQGNGHDFAVDWWGLGVVLYEMLYGRTPFRGENRKETFYRILMKSPEIVGEQTALRDLIGKLLEKDPAKRISVKGIKDHDFFEGINWGSVLRISRPPFIPVWPEEVVKRTNGIDVELFVEGVFGGELGNFKTTVHYNNENKEDDKTLLEASSKPSRTADFFIF